MAHYAQPRRSGPGSPPVRPGATLVAGAVLVGAALAYFWPLVSGSHSLGGDYASYYYPFAQMLARSLAQGELPLWNPYVAGGYHHLANPQAQVFYLPAWLLAFFTSQGRLSFYATELFTLAHYPLAGLFTFLYLRRLQAPPLAALVGGLAFMLSGFMWAQGLHKTMVETATWLPLAFWALEGVGRRPSLKSALWLTLAGALFFLGGFSPLVYICAPFLVAHALLVLRGGEPWGPGPAAKLGWMALGALLALGLVAVQLLPTLELSPLTYRQGFDLQTAVQDSIWPGYLLSALLPLAHWGGARGYSLDELHFYMGLVPLLLAGAAFVGPRSPRCWFWLATVVISLLLALGDNTPLYGWLWQHMPGMKVTRAPGRFALLVDLGISVLAGLGAARLLQRLQREGPGLALLWGLYLALGALGAWALWRLKTGGADPASWGLAPDLASQLTSALIFWGLGLSAWGLYWARSLPSWAATGALALLLAAQALTFPAGMMWSPRPPASFFALDPAIGEALTRLPSGRLGIDLGGAGGDRHELDNLGSMLALPSTSHFDTTVEARLWRVQGSRHPRLLADLLDERLLLSPKAASDLPQALYRPLEIKPGEWANLDLTPLGLGPIRELALVSHLAYAGNVPQGRVVAEALVFGPQGLAYSLPLRAGLETAEWSAAKPGAAMAHAPALVERSWPVDQGAYQGHSYIFRWALDPPLSVARLQIRLLDPEAALKVEAIHLDGRDLFSLGQRYARVQPGLHANRYHLERARLLRSWRVVKDGEAAWRATLLADLGSEAVLEEEPVFPPDAADLEPTDDRVTPTAQGLDWVRLKVTAREPALLLLADVWYPGWQARVNGRAVPVLRADYFLRAVALGAGEQEVVFYYAPAWLPWGAGLSLAALGMTLGLSLWAGLGRGRRRR